MNLSICIPTYNRLSYLKQCLESIFYGFKNYSYEVIVADGGSTDGTLEYLRNLDNIKLIEQGKLTGSVKAFNECIKISNGKYVYPCADDNFHVPDVIIKSCKLMDEEKQIGCVAPKQQEPTYGNLSGLSIRIDQYGLLLPKTIIFRASVLKEIGYFDEKFRTYFIDDDSSLSVLKLGYTLIFTREPGLINFRGYSENKNSARAITSKKIKDNAELKYLQKKWMPLQKKTNEYKNFKSLFFKHLSGMMYYAEWLRPFVEINNNFSMKVYDWLLEQAIVFKDKKYSNMKDFYLAQRFPDEIISYLNETMAERR